MFVIRCPSNDITLEGVLKMHRPKWQTLADLALRAIWTEPSNPLEAKASQNFCSKQGFAITQKSCKGVHKSCTVFAHEMESVACS